MDTLETVFGKYAVEAHAIKNIMKSAMTEIMRIYDMDFGIYEKGRKDWVTDADLACHHLIIEKLAKVFPEDSIISEEDQDHIKKGEGTRTWFVDPLDGTRDFMDKNGEFAIHVGLADHHQCVFGGVGVPALDKIYLGAPGHGTVCIGPHQTMVLQSYEPAGDGELILLTSRFHADFDSEMLKKFVGLESICQHGSFGYKTVLVAERQGHFFLYRSAGTKEWDSCAPEAIIRGIGGHVTDMEGETLQYGKPQFKNSRGVMVSLGIDHFQVLGKLNEFFRMQSSS